MKETVSSDPNWQIVMDLFQHLCVMCWKEAVTIHEIEPRSLRKDWQVVSNRVPLCAHCHVKVHEEGTRNNADLLYKRAVLTLEALDKNVLEWASR